MRVGPLILILGPKVESVRNRSSHDAPALEQKLDGSVWILLRSASAKSINVELSVRYASCDDKAEMGCMGGGG